MYKGSVLLVSLRFKSGFTFLLFVIAQGKPELQDVAILVLVFVCHLFVLQCIRKYSIYETYIHIYIYIYIRITIYTSAQVVNSECIVLERLCGARHELRKHRVHPCVFVKLWWLSMGWAAQKADSSDRPRDLFWLKACCLLRDCGAMLPHQNHRK